MVLTLDQRQSRRHRLEVGSWATRLNERFGDALELPFAQTSGDEIQALVADSPAAVSILLEGIRRELWWAGLGLGEVEHPLGSSAVTSRGTAFYLAREALAKAKRSPYGVAVRGPDPDLARDAEACVYLLGYVIKKRGVTERNSKRWQAVDLATQGLSVDQIAERLGITHQAASERLRTAGYQEELEGRRLAARLLARADIR